MNSTRINGQTASLIGLGWLESTTAMERPSHSPSGVTRKTDLAKAKVPKIIASREQHEAYIQRLLELQRKARRTAGVTTTAKLLVVLIADHEAKQFTVEKASGVEVLRELMDTNGLRQKNLADDLGGESIVSLILKGKRQLNRQQMEKLSQRFHISPEVFF